MVAQQEAIVGENSVVVVGQENNNKNMMMIKGKRTKRPRPLSPLALTMSSTPTTTTDEGGSAMSEEWTAPNSAATSEEEHDMAHCLILLAQGTNQSNSTFNNTTTNNNNNSGTAPSNKASMGISSSYECKTCNKSFASFQALGGHRASHKKPKPNTFTALSDLKNSPSSLIFSLINHDNHHHDDGTTLSLQMANSTLCTPTTNTNTNKSKVHECGICGAEFSSGQALGGHMRRHRPIGMTTSTGPSPSENSVTLINAISKNNNNNVKDVKATRNHFSLDLNLPAPEDEQYQLQQRDSSSSKFVFSSNEKTLVFASASSQLVDCHY